MNTGSISTSTPATALRILAILIQRQGGEVEITPSEMFGADDRDELQAYTDFHGIMHIRVVKYDREKAHGR